jgi:hypothetical protein
MRYHQISVIFVLAAEALVSLAEPLTTLGRHAHDALLECRPDRLGEPWSPTRKPHDRPLRCAQALP